MDDNEEDNKDNKYNKSGKDVGQGRGMKTMRDDDEVEVEDEDGSMIG